ncbi:hypothetical protein VPH35_113605 [Triticum aestivum]
MRTWGSRTRRGTSGEQWEKAERLCWGGGGAIMRDHHGKQIGDVTLFFRNVIMACFIDLVKRLHRLQEHYPGSPGLSLTLLLKLYSARDWYLLQRERYDSVTRELKNYSREVVWTERLAKLLNVVYVLGMPFIVGPLVLKGIAIRRMCALLALIYVHWTAMCSANFALCRAKLLAKSYGLRL